MLQNYNKWKVLALFFNEPLTSGLQLREISRKISLAPPSVKNYLQELKKEGLITEKKSRVQGYPIYLANRENASFLFYKRMDLLNRINTSNLLTHLHDTYLPQTIILFGSATRGEDTEHSDIDIFIEAKGKEKDLTKYEKVLKRKINLLFADKFTQLSKELQNNIINGVVLQGYLKVL